MEQLIQIVREVVAIEPARRLHSPPFEEDALEPTLDRIDQKQEVRIVLAVSPVRAVAGRLPMADEGLLELGFRRVRLPPVPTSGETTFLSKSV